jgi:hypothetical protein
MQTEKNYTEQPFNLETALKHPEWVRTRDGREIDFIKEYPERAIGAQILYVTKEGLGFGVDKLGFWSDGIIHNNDLILRVPYQTVYINIYPNRECYWFNSEKEAEDYADKVRLISTVPVKIPAND